MTTSAFSKTRLARLRDTMAGYVERGELPGCVLLVSRHGEIHVEAIGKHAFDGAADNPSMQRDTIFRIASMTKPIAAVAALLLVEECKLRLDEPVDQWLPELANRQVLRSIDSELTDTVPALRAITLRDLLTFRLGIGMVLARPGTYPILRAISAAGLSPSPNPPLLDPDEWLRRLGALPLIYQPGATWLYHTGSDVLGILIERVSGQTLAEFLRERLFAPLGMSDTGFYVPPEQMQRLPPSYSRQHSSGTFAVHDDPARSGWAAPPALASGGGGLVSTVDDYHAFCRMLLNKGRHGSTRILARPTVELMTSDQLAPRQRQNPSVFLADNTGWGFGVGVALRRDELWMTPGRFGWDGGIGTSAYADPREDMVGILMTQRLMESPQPPRAFIDFWTSAYQAFGD